jgi:hypothetical protein
MIPRSSLVVTSLSCFNWGLTALVPVIGFFGAVIALNKFRIAVIETNDRWNPARVHLYSGMAMALLSLLLHALIVFVIYLQVIRYIGNG